MIILMIFKKFQANTNHKRIEINKNNKPNLKNKHKQLKI